MWSAYFDDHFSIVEKDAARHTDLVISSMFSILGWRLSSDKLVDFNSVCKVLGVQFDLRMSGVGPSFVTNTEDRISELCERLDEILESGKLSRSEGERFRGRLLFAAGQLFGRSTRNHIRTLSMHVQRGRKTLDHETLCALRSIRERISSNVPRKIVGPLIEHVHIYVDVSFEEETYSGIGGVIYDSSGSLLAFFSEELPSEFISRAKRGGQVSVIQEFEMLALLAALDLWSPIFLNKKVVVFTNSEAVRGSFLKTWSNNNLSSDLLLKIFQVEESSMCQIWLERVPSQSNP